MALKKINYTGQSKVILRLCEMVNQLIDGGGGGGGSTVTYTSLLSSGTKTGEIEIDGVSTDMYAPTPPTKLSDLSNDAGFIDSTVNNLVNYYKKTETYTQAEVNALISAIVTLNILVVQTLPTQDISTTTIYLVPKATAETQDVYDEYIYVNNAWEHIGSTQVDLSDYYTKTETDALLDDKVDKVTGKQLSTEDFTSALKSKLEGIEAGAQANVQADWNETDNTSDAYIQNKPTIPDAQIQSDWNQTDTSAKDYIKNKPTIPSGGDSVSWNQIQQTGQKIAEIDINGTTQDVYAPQGGGGSYSAGDGIDITNNEISVDTAFTEASTRANIASGDTLSTIWGKIKKFFSDLKAVAFSGSYNDLSYGNAVIGDGTNYIGLRANSAWKAGMYYHTSADEAMVFANTNTRASWIFANTNPEDRTDWRNLSPAMHIKNGKVAIAKLIADGTYLTYPLEVNGDVLATNFRGDLVGKIPYTHTNEINFKGGKQPTVFFNYRNADTDATDGGTMAVEYRFCNYNNSTAYSTITAGSFNGTAVRAKQDESGNNIKSSYASSLRIEAQGSYRFSYYLYAESGAQLSTGQVTISTSSRKFKKNIAPLSEDDARKILDVETVTFDYKKDHDNYTSRKGYKNIGCIAEDVNEIIPEVVIEDENNEIFGINYIEMIPYLIKMIQIQQKEIEELKAIIKSNE